MIGECKQNDAEENIHSCSEEFCGPWPKCLALNFESLQYAHTNLKEVNYVPKTRGLKAERETEDEEISQAIKGVKGLNLTSLSRTGSGSLTGVYRRIMSNFEDAYQHRQGELPVFV